MKLARVFLFLAIGAALFAGLNALSLVFPQRPEFDVPRMLNAYGRPLDLVVFGGSVAEDIDPKAMAATGAVLALSKSDVFEAEAVAAVILAEGPPPRTAVYALAPTALHLTNSSRGGMSRHRRFMAYRLSAASDIHRLIDGDWRMALAAWWIPALRTDLWRPYGTAVINGLFGRGFRPNRPPPVVLRRALPAAGLTEAQMRALAADQASRQVELVRTVKRYDQGTLGRSKAAIVRMARRFEEAGVRFVVLAPPMPDASMAELAAVLPEETREFDQALRELRRKGVEVLDHSTYAPISSRPGYYYDELHLNQAGSAAYSRFLAAELGKSRGIGRENSRAAHLNQRAF
jgi:predicted DCC family thiol-disulfide oxidoreductase YuxK